VKLQEKPSIVAGRRLKSIMTDTIYSMGYSEYAVPSKWSCGYDSKWKQPCEVGVAYCVLRGL